MRNFKAVIQVAEDAEFRKTVLDAVERVTLAHVGAVLAETIGRILNEPQFQRTIHSAIDAAVRKEVAAMVKSNDAFNEIVKQESETIRATVREKFTDDWYTSLITEAAADTIKKRLKGI